MDFPLEFLHKYAFKTHEAANCAGDQGKYWEMNHQIFTKKGKTAPKYNELLSYGGAIGLDSAAFKQCLDSGKHEAEIRKDIAAGEEAEVKGTPTFFLGLTEPNDSRLKVLTSIKGAQPYSVFKEAFDKLLAP